MKVKSFFSLILIYISLISDAQIRIPGLPNVQVPSGSLTLRDGNGPLNLNEAISISLQNNYDIQLVRNTGLLAALENSYANYALLPRISASGGVLNNNTNSKQVLADGTKREVDNIKSNNITGSVNLNWTLFDGFRMFIARKRLTELMNLSELQIKAQITASVADVMQIYFNIVRQQQQLKAIQEQIDLSSERLRFAQYKFDIGTGAKPDLLQAQIDLNAQKSSYLEAEVGIEKLKEQLNQILVLPLNNQFEIADSSIEFNENLTLDSIQSGLNATNPDLLSAQQNILLAELSLRDTKAQRYPVVSFNSAYNFNKTDNKSVVNPFQPLFNQNKGLNYGFTATVPIFNGLGTRKLIKAAELDMQYQQLAYDQALATVNTSIINTYKDYELYKKRLKLEEENMVLVRENIMIARERYRLGVSTFIEMREAQQSLADAATRLIQARYNTKVAEIELLRLRGDLIK